VVNEEPRPEGTGYLRSVRNGLYAVSIPKHSNINLVQTALKGGVLNPLANKLTQDLTVVLTESVEYARLQYTEDKEQKLLIILLLLKSRLKGDLFLSVLCYKRSMKYSTFNPGDIIVADSFLYKHYGIYAGNGRIINYSSEYGDFGRDIEVREVSFEQFAKGRKCEVIRFADNKTKVFLPKETVKRARSRIGEKRYHLLFNNCEHFALWCKTGKSKSVQVQNAAITVALLSSVVLAAFLAEKTIEEQIC